MIKFPIFNQSLPPYDPDGDGDNDAENAMMAIDASCILMEYARNCLSGEDMDKESMAKAKSFLNSPRADNNKSNVLPFNQPKTKSVLRINNKTNSDTVQMDMFGVVGGDWWGDGGITRDSFAKELKGIPSSVKTVDLRMSSPGGDVFEGRAIANLMSDHRCAFNINVISECCSIATIIAMAGDTIHMSDGSVFLVHRCYTIALGNSQELGKLAKDLELIDETMVKTYQNKTKMSQKDILSLMDENRYMNADEAKKLGFVDSISEDTTNASSLLRIAALDIDRSKFHLPPLPKDSQPRRKAALAAMARMKI
jgi:ATP-dependent protease ClpP protease subunit